MVNCSHQDPEAPREKKSMYSYTAAFSMACWHMPSWVHGFKLLMPNCDPTGLFASLSTNQDTDQAMLLCAPWADLFLTDRTGSHCNRFKVRSAVHCEKMAYPFCIFASAWPLSSTTHFYLLISVCFFAPSSPFVTVSSFSMFKVFNN